MRGFTIVFAFGHQLKAERIQKEVEKAFRKVSLFLEYRDGATTTPSDRYPVIFVCAAGRGGIKPEFTVQFD